MVDRMTSDALFAAIVGGGTVDDVRCLLSAGVDANRPFRDGMCPLNAAIAHRRHDIVRLLLASDRVDVNQVTMATGLVVCYALWTV
jgi:ankyrin repeat protein